MSEDQSHAVEMKPIGEGGRVSYLHREGYEATPDDPRIEGLSAERAEELVTTGIFEHADADDAVMGGDDDAEPGEDETESGSTENETLGESSDSETESSHDDTDADEASEGGGSEGDADDSDEDEDEDEDDFTDLDGVGDATAAKLVAAGYETFDDLADADRMALASVSNVSEDLADNIHDQLAPRAEYVDEDSTEDSEA